MTKVIIPGIIKERLQIAIGIDPGVNTGLAVWDMKLKQFTRIVTVSKVEAQDIIIFKLYNIYGDGLLAVMEDARLAKMRIPKFFSGPGRYQGAGDIKGQCRDFVAWFEFHGIAYTLTKPRSNYLWKPTKNKELFQKTTGWQGVTSEHARVACELVYQIG